MRGRRLIAALAATLGALGVAAAATPAQADPLPVGGLPQAVANYVASPDQLAGVNDFSCQPSAAHPYPVVLLPGTGANFGANFVALAPMLKNAGYCVFATNFGMTALSFGRAGGFDHETVSGDQVAAFVNQVRAATGAAKVDLVGHSQGGAMGINYVKLHGGAASVDTYVGWGQSANGTTLSGLTELGTALNLLGFVNLFFDVAQLPGLADQEVGSDYSKLLWAGGDTLPAGPDYVTIQTTHDEVVTPYQTQSLPGAQNLVVQDYCPQDPVGHVGLFLDGPTLALTLNALNHGPADYSPPCTGYGLPL